MNTQSKMGRPEKPPEERRTNVLRVCLTGDERELLDKVADGKTSTWVRELAIKAAARKSRPA